MDFYLIDYCCRPTFNLFPNVGKQFRNRGVRMVYNVRAFNVAFALHECIVPGTLFFPHRQIIVSFGVRLSAQVRHDRISVL